MADKADRADSKCPLCGAGRTRSVEPYGDGLWVEAPFKSQKCANEDCGLPCNLWDRVEGLLTSVNQTFQGFADAFMHWAVVRRNEKGEECV